MGGRKSGGGRPWDPLRYTTGQMLKARDGVWPSLTREANGSSVTQLSYSNLVEGLSEGA